MKTPREAAIEWLWKLATAPHLREELTQKRFVLPMNINFLCEMLLEQEQPDMGFAHAAILSNGLVIAFHQRVVYLYEDAIELRSQMMRVYSTTTTPSLSETSGFECDLDFSMGLDGVLVGYEQMEIDDSTHHQADPAHITLDEPHNFERAAANQLLGFERFGEGSQFHLTSPIHMACTWGAHLRMDKIPSFVFEKGYSSGIKQAANFDRDAHMAIVPRVDNMNLDPPITPDLEMENNASTHQAAHITLDEPHNSERAAANQLIGFERFGEGSQFHFTLPIHMASTWGAHLRMDKIPSFVFEKGYSSRTKQAAAFDWDAHMAIVPWVDNMNLVPPITPDLEMENNASTHQGAYNIDFDEHHQVNQEPIIRPTRLDEEGVVFTNEEMREMINGVGIRNRAIHGMDNQRKKKYLMWQRDATITGPFGMKICDIVVPPLKITGETYHGLPPSVLDHGFHGEASSGADKVLPEETGPSNICEPCLTRATLELKNTLQRLLEKPDARVSIDYLCTGMKRPGAALLFYQICVLASMDFVEIKQELPHADIFISKGSKM